MPFPAEPIPVSVPQILRVAGHNAFARGERYYRAGKVLDTSWDPERLTFTSRVAGGSTRPYSQSVVFPERPVPHAAPFHSFCSCPVGTNCKHVVAALLAWFHEGGWGVPEDERPRRSTAVEPQDRPGPSEATHPETPMAQSEAQDEPAEADADPRAAEIERLRRTMSSMTGGAQDGRAPAAPAPPDASALPAARPGPDLQNSWRRHMARALSSQSLDHRSRALRSPAALDLRLGVPARHGLGMGSPEAPAPVRLSARPLMLGARGRWIKGGLDWNSFSGGRQATSEVLPEHQNWFRELYAVAQPDQNPYSSTRDWLHLDTISSPLLWDLLDHAASLGIVITAEGHRISVALAPDSRLGLHVQDAADGGLALRPALSIPRTADRSGAAAPADLAHGDEAREAAPLWVPAEQTFPIGSGARPQAYVALGGALQRTYEWAAQHSGTWSSLRSSPLPRLQQEAAGEPWLEESAALVFLPLEEEPSALAVSLAASGPLEVPSEDVGDFAEGFYPQLVRHLEVTADPEAQEALPQVLAPELVLEAAFEETASSAPAHRAAEQDPEDKAAEHTDGAEEDALPLVTTDAPAASGRAGSGVRIAPARTRWYWSYPASPVRWEGQDPVTRTEVPVQVPHPDPHRELRDADLEHAVVSRVRQAVPDVEFSPQRTQGWQTRDLVEQVLPRVAEIEGVRTDVRGPLPEFRPLDEDPVITVTVESTGDRDWFGLGVVIKANGWHVPFADVFRALDAGQKHLLLGDNSWFRLDRPEFQQLRELIAEAREIDDKGGPLRISRHQAGLWEDLEELAADVDVAEAWQDSVRDLLEIREIPTPPLPRSVSADLRPYQLEGYRWLSFLYDHGLGGILADDMGLGKTLQTITMFCHAFQEWDERQADHQTRAATSVGGAGDAVPGSPRPRFLVVAPTSVAPNWAREIARFAPGVPCTVLTQTSAKDGRTVAERAEGADVVVTSYALLRLDAEEYAELDLTGLVLDEAQFLKNPKTKAHRLVRDLPVPFKLAVTGTPLENDLMELWSMFSIVAPGLFPSARKFRDHYARPIAAGEDPEALPRLRRRVRPLMLRRTKELVAADLPEKQEHRVDLPLEPAHRKIYDTRLQRERQKILGLLQDMDRNRFTIFQSLTMLRRLALSASLVDPRYEGVASAKLLWLAEQLPEIIADGHRALVFSQFTSFLRQIGQALDEAGIPYLYLDGSTRNRAEVLAGFAEGEAPVFLISLKAGGFGLNLTEADYCFLMDPWWNPAVEAQAVDRAHRIGQLRNVMVYRLVSAGTIEEKVMDLKASKAALFDAVMDEGEAFSQSLQAADIRELLGG